MISEEENCICKLLDVTDENSEHESEEEYFSSVLSEDFDKISILGEGVTETCFESIPNINSGNSILLSTLFIEMFNFIGVHLTNSLNTNLSFINNKRRFFSSHILFRTKMIFYPNFRKMTPLGKKYYLFETFFNLYVFDITKNQFISIIRSQNCYLPSYEWFYTNRLISVFDDKNFIWRKLINYMIFNIDQITNPICFSIRYKHYPGPGTFIVYPTEGKEYLINVTDRAYFSYKQDHRYNPDFMVGINNSPVFFAILKNETLCMYHKEHFIKFFNIKNKKISEVQLDKHIISNTCKVNNATIISDNFRGLQKVKEIIKETFDIDELSTIDQKGKIFCYKDSTDFYIFNKNRILHKFQNKHGYSCLLLNKRFYFIDTRVNREDSEYFSCIYDSKSKSTKYFPIQNICLEEIFWYQGKLYYIVYTYTEIMVISFEDNKTLITFDSSQHGTIIQVIVGPNDWLISLTKGNDYVCVWGINEKKLIIALPLDNKRVLENFFYKTGLHLYNTKDLIIYHKDLYYCNLDELDSGLIKHKNRYIYDPLKEKMYFFQMIEESNEMYMIIFHSTYMKTINENPYKFKYTNNKIPNFQYLLDLENFVVISSIFTISVFDKTNNILLHTKDMIGINREQAPIDGYFDYFIPSYCIDGLLKISDELVLVREVERNQNILGYLYIYNIRNNTIISHIQPYEENYYCDILYRFHNGKFALRFKVSFIEIWDFNLMQCNTKIDAIEAKNIKEINTNAFAVMSSNGIQIMSIKF